MGSRAAFVNGGNLGSAASAVGAAAISSWPLGESPVGSAVLLA